MKEILLYAAGHSGNMIDPRHVYICWSNGSTEEGNFIMQIIQLAKQGNYFHYYDPYMEVCHRDTLEDYQQWILGTFSLEQREKIIELASQVDFVRDWTSNGCRVWIRKLLSAMVEAVLIDRMLYEHLRRSIPLPQDQPEPWLTC